MSDAFTDGRRFRILAIFDDHTREDMTLIADASLSGLCVTRELSREITERGMLGTIVVEDGTEFTSTAIFRWVQETNRDGIFKKGERGKSGRVRLTNQPQGRSES